MMRSPIGQYYPSYFESMRIKIGTDNMQPKCFESPINRTIVPEVKLWLFPIQSSRMHVHLRSKVVNCPTSTQKVDYAASGPILGICSRHSVLDNADRVNVKIGRECNESAAAGLPC